MFHQASSFTWCAEYNSLSPQYLRFGRTALHSASRAGMTAIIELPLDRGAGVHAVDEWVEAWPAEVAIKLGKCCPSCGRYFSFSTYENGIFHGYFQLSI